MPAFTSIVLGTLAAASIGSTVYQGVQAGKARDEAKAAGDAQAAQQEKLLQEAKDKQAKEEQKAQLREQGLQAQAAQRAKMGSYQGRQSTILTSPLGLPNPPQPQAGGKTLLGT